VNAARPDAIIILGDLVVDQTLGAKFVAPELIAAELAQLRSRAGTFAVLGNHDWWLDAPRVIEALRAAHVVVLEDSAALVTHQNRRYWLAGISDLWEGRHDVDMALRAVPASEPVIAFTHNPDIFLRIPARVSLTLAGHTHGGQVRLPFVGALIVPSDFGQRFAAGHVVEGGRHLYVHTGSGTSMLPVRFRVPPEIVMLTLRPASQ
jgi:predicted MPP superfamily phosphohydrolase